MMAGRHARRTTVTPLDGEVGKGLGRWRVDFATFDRPGNPFVVVGRHYALDIAHAYERSKARARFIEEQAAPRGPLRDRLPRLPQLAQGVGPLVARPGRPASRKGSDGLSTATLLGPTADAPKGVG